MITGPEALWRKFDARLAARNVPEGERAGYRKWLRYYLDFCHKNGHACASPESLPPFLTKLASKRQTETQCGQAEAAVWVQPFVGFLVLPRIPVSGGAVAHVLSVLA